jgi:hypothetical protein
MMAWTRIKEHSINITGIILATILFMWGTWQLDIICAPPVWSFGWSHSVGRYADDPFQSWIWKTTVGTAYDVLIFIKFAAFILLFISLWMWNEKTNG